MTIVSSRLGGMLKGQQNQLSSCVKLLLLWVGASDGRLDDSEREFAAERVPDPDETVTADDLLAIIRNGDLASIEMALRTVGSESRELRTAFLDLAIAMSMADKRIANTENHILRFYADALYLGAAMLEKRFLAVNGAALPQPGDLSDPHWWQREEAQASAASAGQGEAIRITEHVDEGEPVHGMPGAAGPAMDVVRARRILGVDENAGPDDVEHAYQALLTIFKVDHVEAMGEAAMAVANRRFNEVQRAYATLRGARA